MELLAPSELVPSLKRIWGSPKSWAGRPARVTSPILDGSKLWSSGKKPSAKRLYPPRNSKISFGEIKWVKDSDTRFTRVGVTVLYPGTVLPPPSAKGKL